MYKTRKMLDIEVFSNANVQLSQFLSIFSNDSGCNVISDILLHQNQFTV